MQRQNDPILAAAFAGADSTDQAKMLDAFARELFVVCGGRRGQGTISSQGYEGQCCSISGKLGEDGIALIEDLHAFIELRKKEIAQ